MTQKYKNQFEPDSMHYLVLLADMRYLVTAIAMFVWTATLYQSSLLNGMSEEFVRPVLKVHTLLGIVAVPSVIMVWAAHWYVSKMALTPKVATAWKVWQVVISLVVFAFMLMFLSAI